MSRDCREASEERVEMSRRGDPMRSMYSRIMYKHRRRGDRCLMLDANRHLVLVGVRPELRPFLAQN